MTRETDVRNPATDRTTTSRSARLASQTEAVSRRLSAEHTVEIESFDSTTGNPHRIVSEAAPVGEGDYVQRALSHIRAIRPVLGLTPDERVAVDDSSVTFVPDPSYRTTSSGAVAVSLRQTVFGIPVFEASKTVRFDPDGAITETIGRGVTVPASVTTESTTSALAAVVRAAEYLADNAEDEATDQFGEPIEPIPIDLSAFAPTITAAFTELPEQPHVFEGEPFDTPSKSHLTWFPTDDEFCLAWSVTVTLPDAEQYLVVIDTQGADGAEPAVLYCRQVSHAATARGRVFTEDGGGEREMCDFAELWVTEDETSGNNVIAVDDEIQTYLGSVDDGEVVFDPDADSEHQHLLNAFYFVNRLHDRSAELGFGAAAGNFQQRNLGHGGRETDRVNAICLPKAIRGTATMGTPPDGRAPLMKLGLVASTGRHTALDSSVVYHEYTHGITNRLVGGPSNTRALLAPQSGGMGEGWSDYVACTINDTEVVGSWVTDNPDGIRRYRYDESFPDGFDDLGSGRYGPENVHAIGEIWCATLVQLNRAIGDKLAFQLVVDSLKLMSENPSMLDSRDAILHALSHMEMAGTLSSAERASRERDIWETFAAFGMGPDARSNGASVEGIEADYSLPPEPTVTDEVVAIVPAPEGYWVVTVRGRVYAFDGATDYGSVGATEDDPVVGMAGLPSGEGYWIVQQSGTVHAFGDATDEADASVDE